MIPEESLDVEIAKMTRGEGPLCGRDYPRRAGRRSVFAAVILKPIRSMAQATRADCGGI